MEPSCPQQKDDFSQPLSSFAGFEEFLARFTNYERLQFVKYDKNTFGIERMRSFAADLGDPQSAIPAVHIAGTKGKGATCLILEALLMAEGHAVGTYTSPHVEDLRERIRIGGKPIEEADLLAELNRMLPVLRRRNEEGPSSFPSFFELMTAVAMMCFKRKGLDWTILEVGLGGRLDATNIVRPRICAITSIGLEHTQQLGNTLREIAREKAGIIKEGIPVVLGALPEEAEGEIRRIARERDAPVVPVDATTVRAAGSGVLRIAGVESLLPAGAVVGPGLRMDLAIALSILEKLLPPEGKAARAEGFAAALAGLSLPARVEVFRGDVEIVVDGAHTAESVRSLRLTLEELEFPRPRTLIFSLSAGKDIPGILKELPLIADEIIFTRADPVRSVPPETLRHDLGEGKVIEDPKAAFAAASRGGRHIVISGSFYLAGILRPVVRDVLKGAAESAPPGRE